MIYKNALRGRQWARSQVSPEKHRAHQSRDAWQGLSVDQILTIRQDSGFSLGEPAALFFVLCFSAHQRRSLKRSSKYVCVYIYVYMYLAVM